VMAGLGTDAPGDRKNEMKPATIRLMSFIVLPLIFSGLLMACSARPSENSPKGSVDSVSANTTAIMDTRDFSLSNANAQTSQPDTDNVSLLLRAEDYDKAIEDGMAALAGSPSDSALRQKLADAYIARAWFYKAKRLTTYTLADLFKAVEIAPDYYRAHYEIGRFHNNQWQFSIGLLDLNKSLSLQPDFAPAYTERAYSNFKNQKYEQALADANRSIDLAPSDPRPYCTRSLIYVATDKPGLALEDANKAVRIAPSDAPSYYNRGLVYTATGKSDLAIADFKAALDLSDDDLLTARAGAELQRLQK
jgi:tetratricopeptide (TPR) repeat protein